MRRDQALKRSISILTTLGALSLAVSAQAQTAAPAPTREPASDPEHVRDLLTRGTEALSANKNEEARSLLGEAFRLKRSYDVAAALGQSELELGKYRDAAEHFDFAIREFPPGESRKLLKQLEEAFATAKAHVAALHVTVNQAGREVTVDGALVGTSPLPRDVFAEPGQHTLGARVGAGSGVERVVAVAAGKDYTVELALNPNSAVPATSADSTPTTLAIPPEPRSSISPKTIALISGGAVTVVLLGVGIAERVRASGADDDAAAARARLPDNCFSGGQSALCHELSSDLSRRNSANRLAVITFAGAGVAAAATAALWLLWDEPHTSPNRSQSRSRVTQAFSAPKVLFDVSPHNAAFSLTTTF